MHSLTPKGLTCNTSTIRKKNQEVIQNREQFVFCTRRVCTEMYDSDVIDAQFHSTQHFKREQTGKWYCNYDPTNWTRRRMVHVYPDRYHEILNQARLFKGIWISTAPERFKLYLLLFRSSFQISIPGMRVCGFRERSNDCRVGNPSIVRTTFYSSMTNSAPENSTYMWHVTWMQMWGDRLNLFAVSVKQYFYYSTEISFSSINSILAEVYNLILGHEPGVCRLDETFYTSGNFLSTDKKYFYAEHFSKQNNRL